ncbi:MAG: N-acetylornithine carbamoyltransferase [Myxococcales bacterium]|nr:N-acetylornithine carbamoyltransferase [Myxococcales bacterium]MCB9752401.1 N-acetylornithine carbamoyltransferase [Myxococcales bacterium]
MRHFLTTEDWTRAELQRWLDDARELKTNPLQPRLRGKSIALLFFNPSLRTRTSFELGAHQLGAKAIVLEPGKGAWPIEFEDGAIMDGDAEEHVREVARVLSRYCDAIAVRAFPKFQDWSVDREDRVIRQFAAHATVPVINMETIVHPCQELALMLTLQERLGGPQATDGRKFVLTWTYHPRPLNTAVANSALMIAAKFGMDVTLLCPESRYVLDDRYMRAALRSAQAQGRQLHVTHDIAEAYDGADVVYAKSWGALPFFGDWARERPIRDEYKHFIVDAEKMRRTAGGGQGYFSHCLPARRNIKVTDEVIDGPRSLVIDEAENRLHVQKAMLSALLA